MAPDILVVEDEPSIREAFDLVLGARFRLHLASTAEEALALPASVADDVRLIFLDGFLGPGLDGETALPAFKRKFPFATVVYTGASGSAKVPALHAAGATLVLTKPWTGDALVDTADWGVRRSNLLRGFDDFSEI